MQSPFRPVIPMENDKNLFNTYLDYILHRSGSQLNEAQCGATLGRDALALQAQLYNAPHDTDNVRSHLISTVETLLLIMNNTGLTRFYYPNLLIAHLEEDPQVLNRTLSNTVQAILHQLTNRQGDKVDDMANLLEKVDCFIEAALKRGQFTNFDNLSTLALEYYNFWPVLREQRAAYIATQPGYKYQLEHQSIFPLKYELVNNRDNPLSRLIKLHGFHNEPVPRYLDMLEVNSQLNSMAHYMPNNQEPNSQNNAIAAIARITNWPERKLNKNNPFTFLPLIVATIKPPAFSEAWAVAQPSRELPPLHHSTANRAVRTVPRRRAVPNIQQQAQPVPVIRNTGIVPPATPITGISSVYSETPDCISPTPARAAHPHAGATARKKLFDISNTSHANTPTTDDWCTPLNITPPCCQEFSGNKENFVTWNLNTEDREILQEFIGLPGVHYSPISPAT